MGSLEELGRLCDVESFLRFFDIDFEPALVKRERVRILQLFARAVDDIDRRWPRQPEEARLEMYQAALSRAYLICAPRSCGKGQWPFRVISGSH